MGYQNLDGEGAAKVFSAWNTAVRLCWDCPRDTRTYLVQQVLSCGQTSARTDLLARYSKFFTSLRASTSLEVSTMANLVARNIQSTTGRNLAAIGRASGLSPWKSSNCKLKTQCLKEAIKKLETVEPEPSDLWRIPFLDRLLGHRQELGYCGEDTDDISSLINSLCIN